MLKAADLQRFRDDGVLVVPGVVDPGKCRAVIAAICEFEGVDPEARDRARARHGHGIVPLHHHQAMWDIRQDPRLHAVFSALYGTDALWVSMDRVSYKPPAREGEALRRDPFHWDCDPWNPGFDLSIQGLLYLTDTPADQGAFLCAPHIYRQMDAWLETHADDDERRLPKIAKVDEVAVGGPAGSLVVFNRMMPHTSDINRGLASRLVQYVTMQPAVPDEEVRLARIREWREKRPPAWAIRQNVKGQLIPEPGEPAALSPLGEKLVGVRPWQAS